MDWTASKASFSTCDSKSQASIPPYLVTALTIVLRLSTSDLKDAAWAAVMSVGCGTATWFTVTLATVLVRRAFMANFRAHASLVVRLVSVSTVTFPLLDGSPGQSSSSCPKNPQEAQNSRAREYPDLPGTGASLSFLHGFSRYQAKRSWFW